MTAGERIYKENADRSTKLCLELEANIALRKKFALKEAFGAYEELSKTIDIIRIQLDSIWDQQLELKEIIDGERELEQARGKHLAGFYQ